MNIIDACSFHYPEEDTSVYPGLAFGSTKVICKLTDKNGNVVAEGTRVGMIAASQTVHIAITDLASLGGCNAASFGGTGFASKNVGSSPNATIVTS